MTHITLSKKTTSKPSLEFYSDGSGEARRVTIEHFPFRIGRSESADLRVDSVEISREHAEIVERNGMWLVRDLGSTNGTQVNGKQIKETLLADGDILRLAETELTFIASASSQFQRMVTQPIQSKPVAAAPNMIPAEVAATRMLCEATLWQAIPMQLFSATSLRHGTTEAFFAHSSASGTQKPPADQSREVADRYRELERMRALELASAAIRRRSTVPALWPGRDRIASQTAIQRDAASEPIAGHMGAGHYDLASRGRRYFANHLGPPRGKRPRTAGCLR